MARTGKDRNREISRNRIKKKQTIEDYKDPENPESKDPISNYANGVQPHKTNGITRRGHKTTPGILLRG